MTLEQLLCPAVITWEKNFRQHLNESNITTKYSLYISI